MKTKALLLILTTVLLLIGLELAHAQSTNSPSITNAIPPSPEAQSFMRYGEIPVDLSTGVPDIQIPLYQVASGKLSLPVAISYHASGIKVSDVASVVGLGWRLSAGGVLTKTVLGKPDNDPSYGMFSYPYLTKAQIDALTPQTYTEWPHLKMIAQGTMDGESDRYYYSAGNGLSGDFFYDNAFNIVQATYSDNKIIKVSETSYKVVGVDGTQYFFENPEYSHTNMDPPYVSSWWLSRIVSADNADAITFEYQTQYTPTVSFVQSQSLTEDGTTSPILFEGSQTNTNPVLLKKIVFKNGYISFDYLNDRKDMQTYRLSTVNIYAEGNANPLKKYQFTHSYFYSNVEDNKYNYRLKLDQVSVYDASLKNIQNYSFEYDQEHAMPPYTQDPNVNNSSFCYAQDYFGYFNGIYTNQHLLTGFYSPIYTSANRNPDYNYAKTCILKKINYPTGGSTSFEYQLNEGQGGQTQMAAGLRIHRIVSNTDANTTATVKRYEYANNLLQLNLEVSGFNQYDWEPAILYNSCQSLIQQYTTFVANPVLPYTNFHGSPVLYQGVDVYEEGNVSNINLKTSYEFGADNDDIIGVNSKRYINQYYLESPWRKGQLKSVNHYKYSPTLGYVLKKRQIYTYDDFRVNTVIAGTKVELIHPIINKGCGYLQWQPVPPDTYQSLFTYFDIPIKVGIRKLINVSTSEIDDSGNTIAGSESTSYDSPYHLFPTKKIIAGSNSDTKITVFTYPRDYAGTAVYDQMIARNIISPVIEKPDYKNSTANFLQSTKTDFSFWANGQTTTTATDQIYPSTVSTKKGAGSYDARVQFLSYNANGNMQSANHVGGAKVNYVYGYGGSYPIAQITNADYSTIETLLGGQSNVNSFRDILNPTDLQVNNFLANLRVAGNLPNTQVTTYTYKPLIGMTSATDAKGLTTYYEYDDFQRLRFVRDKDHKILKAYCYNYKGQQTNCYTPGAQWSTVYARIEISNVTYSNSGDYEYNYSSSYGDAYVHFYSDPECQTPLTLTSAITVTMAETLLYDTEYSYGTNVYNIDYNVPTGVSSYYLGNLTLYDYSSYNDGYNYHYNYNDYTYDMVLHTGSNYTPETTIFN